MSKSIIAERDILSEIYKEFPEKLEDADINRLRHYFSEFMTGFLMMMGKGPFVTVFGGSRLKQDTPWYDMARKLGNKLGAAGYGVLTGGGPGFMEAVNRGAHETGGKSMGINISIPEEQEANLYAEQTITINHFFVRKVLLLKYSTSYIFFPGGFGTLDELFETVTLMQTKKIEPFPVIMMCTDYWKGLMAWLEEKPIKEGMINGGDMKYFHFVDNLDDAMVIIKKYSGHERKDIKQG